MTAKGWREAIVEAAFRNDNGDPSALDLLALLLEEQDRAKQALRDKSYGCTGMPWPEMVAEVPEFRSDT